MRAADAAPAAMLQRPIPRSGEMLPAIGLGSWRTLDIGGSPQERSEARETLRRFAELGGRVVDSSPMYGSAESVIGSLAAELQLTRRLFLATKVWTSGRAAGVRQMEESMRRLGVERLDLMQVHNLVDAETHLATLREWKSAGRVRYLGVTHYRASAHDELERLMRGQKLDFVQVNLSLAEPEADDRLLAAARDTGTAVLVNRPFAEGALFPRVRGKALPDWAAEIDCASWAQFFLKWILAHPAVTCVIPATGNPRHVADNMGAGLGRLPDQPMRRRMLELVRSL